MHHIHNEIDKLISQTNSLRGALFALKNNAGLLGGCDVAYEHMVRANSHIRGDLVSMTTLPHELTDLYYPSGGTNNDPVIENVGNTSGLIKVDLDEVLRDPTSKYFANPFFTVLYNAGQVSLASYSVKNQPFIGHMALTVFETKKQRDRNVPIRQMVELFDVFRTSLHKHGHLVRYFGLGDDECLVLQRSADGRIAGDIAVDLGVTRRTIELRLQSARKKLHAFTTTEAVYKAVAYGVLPFKA